MANWTKVAGVFFLALLLRLLYLAEVADSPYFETLVLDAEEYDYLAGELLDGNWRLDGKDTYVHGPLYPTALALLKLLGLGAMGVRFVQAILGALSCVLIYRIGDRLFDRPVPLIAGLLAAGYWPFLFFGGELFATTLFIAVELVLVDLLLRFGERSPRRRPLLRQCMAAGLLLGLLMGTRANAVLALPVVAWWMHRHLRAAPGRERWRGWLAFALLLAVTLSPFALRNHAVQGGPVPFQGGWSFYMGTNPAADGTPYVRQGLSWQRHELLPLRAGVTEPSARGMFYLESGLRYIADNPADYLHLLYRKFRLFWSAFEIPVSSDLSYYREHSALHGALVLNFGVIAPLALAGLLLGRRRDAPYRLVWGFVLAFLGTGLLFTVSARYRVPAAPFLIIAAADALWHAVLLARGGGRRRAGVYAAVVAAAAVLVHTGVDEAKVDHVRSDLLLGYVHQRNQEYDLAVAAYGRGLEKSPDDADLLNGLGTVHGAQGRDGAAAAAFRKATEVAPDYAQPRFNLAGLHLRAGRLEEAATELAEALRLDLRPVPQHQGHQMLGNVHMARGDYRAARAAFERALEHRESVLAWYDLSNASARSGDTEAQMHALGRAIELAPDFAPALRNLGFLHMQRQELDAAEEMLLRSIQHEPGSPVAHRNLGALYLKRGQNRRAREAFAEAERLRAAAGQGRAGP